MSCDVELTKDGGPGLSAHRNILAAVSQRFDKLLKAENGGTEMVPVIDTRILTRVMDFIYEDQAVFEEEEYNDFTDALNFLKIDLVLSVTRPLQYQMSTPTARCQELPLSATGTPRQKIQGRGDGRGHRRSDRRIGTSS